MNWPETSGLSSSPPAWITALTAPEQSYRPEKLELCPPPHT